MDGLPRKITMLLAPLAIGAVAAVPALATGHGDGPAAKGKPEYKLPKGDPRPDKGKEPEHAHGNKLPKAAPPKLGKTLGAKPGRGRVTIKLPGSRRPIWLEDAASVPVGSTVDATKGSLKLTAANRAGGIDYATFSGAVFKVVQGRGGVTQLTLRGKPGPCKARRATAGISRKRRARKLWGRGKGRFRTRGRYGAATVRGTVWMTQNTCKGTLVKVRRGVVDVRDFAKKKTVEVEAGERYLARRKRR